MNLNKRELMTLGLGTVAALTLPALPAFAEGDKTAERIKTFTGGKEPTAGKVSLSTPEIAENGNTVPVSVTVDSPMSEESYVQSVLILADGNPEPGIATFNFSPMSGEAAATTRIRLAKTQNVVAVAKMNDGSFFMDKKLVKVTIGGCGG
jgi:sulfur-oxidizing protein SoxY